MGEGEVLADDGINNGQSGEKSIAQIYMQTQRLLGQQSLAEFMGLHLNL